MNSAGSISSSSPVNSYRIREPSPAFVEPQMRHARRHEETCFEQDGWNLQGRIGSIRDLLAVKLAARRCLFPEGPTEGLRRSRSAVSLGKRYQEDMKLQAAMSRRSSRAMSKTGFASSSEVSPLVAGPLTRQCPDNRNDQ